ncbi:hypothetical protein CEXT_702611 [Caerostris extrusa]|uniref:Uncharacterized protein n=1 Tax=Caerostris extrusa TaxID=172846 RepID=A0AAV4NME7_CAEEX|nr:hypothetical protein CEXT_702611 [Caerostris extrusa]
MAEEDQRNIISNVLPLIPWNLLKSSSGKDYQDCRVQPSRKKKKVKLEHTKKNRESFTQGTVISERDRVIRSMICVASFINVKMQSRDSTHVPRGEPFIKLGLKCCLWAWLNEQMKIGGRDDNAVWKALRVGE